MEASSEPEADMRSLHSDQSAHSNAQAVVVSRRP